jgi:hypothetical protein
MTVLINFQIYHTVRQHPSAIGPPSGCVTHFFITNQHIVIGRGIREVVFDVFPHNMLRALSTCGITKRTQAFFPLAFVDTQPAPTTLTTAFAIKNHV